VSVQAALKPLLPHDTILCTDGRVTLASVAQAVNISQGVRGP